MTADDLSVDLHTDLFRSCFLVFRQRHGEYAVTEFGVDLRSVHFGREPLRPAGRPVHRPLHNMTEGYAEGTVVGIEYLQSYYCPTTPSSDLDPPFGHGNGRPESEDSAEYQVPPCFFGDTGTGSVLPDRLQAGAFPGVGARPQNGRVRGRSSPRALA